MTRPVWVRALILALVIAGTSVDAAAQSRPAPPAGPRPPQLLVVPFGVEAVPGASGLAGAPFWLGEAAAVALTDNLRALGIAAATRRDRMAVYESLQLPAGAPLTRATVIRAGEAMGATAVVVGDVRLADRLTVRARVIDLATGRQHPEATADGGAAELFTMFDTLARRLSAVLPGGATPEPLPRRTSVESFEDYVKGLVAATPEAQTRFLEAALVHAPNDPRVLLALWRARTAQDDHARALDAATRVPPDARERREARFLAALSLIALKRYDEAFRSLDALYKEAPAATLSAALGVVQLRRGTATGGAAAYFLNRAVDERPGDSDVAFDLGYAYALAGDPPAAVYWLREVVRRQPADGPAHLVLSAMLAAQGKPVEAQREFDLARALGAVEGTATSPTDRVPRGLERVPDDLEPPAWLQAWHMPEPETTMVVYVERGRALMDELRDREAIDEFRRAIYVAPYADQPHLWLGRVLLRAGRTAEAMEEFTVAIWCRDTADAHAGLASAALAAGKRDVAKAEAERALARDPAHAEAREVLRQLGGGAPEGAC